MVILMVSGTVQWRLAAGADDICRLYELMCWEHSVIVTNVYERGCSGFPEVSESQYIRTRMAVRILLSSRGNLIEISGDPVYFATFGATKVHGRK